MIRFSPISRPEGHPKSPCWLLLLKSTGFHNDEETLAEWYSPLQMTKRKQTSYLVELSLFLPCMPSSDDWSFAKCNAPSTLVEFLKLRYHIMAQNCPLKIWVGPKTTWYCGERGIQYTCTFFLEIGSSSSHLTGRAGRDSGPHSIVLALHGLPYMKFPTLCA